MRIVPLLLLPLLLGPGVLAAQDEAHWQQLFSINQRFAEAGSKEGQFKLAEMYEEGRGTAVDLAAARKWYEKAAKQGHADAQQRINEWEGRQASRAADARKRAEEERIHRETLAAQKRQEEQRRELEQKRAQEEKARQTALKRAEAEKARQAVQKRVDQAKARQALAKPTPPVQEPAPLPAAPSEKAVAEQVERDSFESDPCKTSAARFMSTCRK